MPAASISVIITKDINDKVIKIDYDLINVGKNQWFALWINDTKIKRFRTNNFGNLIGSQNTIPVEYIIPMLALGSFSTRWSDDTRIPSTGIIAGQTVIVEDSDNEGIEIVPNVGTWALDVRYD